MKEETKLRHSIGNEVKGCSACDDRLNSEKTKPEKLSAQSFIKPAGAEKEKGNLK